MNAPNALTLSKQLSQVSFYINFIIIRVEEPNYHRLFPILKRKKFQKFEKLLKSIFDQYFVANLMPSYL